MFGHMDRMKYIGVHTIFEAFGPERASGLLFLHTVSGCATISSTSGIRKKIPWDTW